MFLIFRLLLASLLISSCSSRYLKSLHSYDNTLANLFEALEQQNPCATKQCDFPSKCITMPNTECSDCSGIAMCVHYG
ncbi:hypothetical protein L596_009812 [Steinernema carpocapsae]|uniref:Uncharacterized protein n=1 Tax=Steinernema carpocapsae TaxID=34508 RepID=A0A4U5PGS0_STECR|nr:hypothetical protein L596_009812 [Steinernema carpocapsae]